MSVDLKAHKKYFHTMREFPDSIIITADDDLIYPKTFVSSLMKSYKKYPDCISARRVHKIIWDENGQLMPYNSWPHNYTQCLTPRFDLLATGGAGALYPPHILPKETFDVDSIHKLSLNSDDIWLKFMELMNSVPVVWTYCFIIHPPIIEGTQKITLMSTNVNKGENDIFVSNLMKKYPESAAKIKTSGMTD